jgi:hypothetical protein
MYTYKSKMDLKISTQNLNTYVCNPRCTPTFSTLIDNVDIFSTKGKMMLFISVTRVTKVTRRQFGPIHVLSKLHNAQLLPWKK